MNKRIVKSSIVFFLLAALIFGQLPLPKTMAAEDSVPNNETTLTSASPVEASFQSDDEVHWYKVNPSNQEIANYTHFRVKLKSDAELNISVYSSLENATGHQTFDRYNGYSYENNPALIDFPIAWKGPYYIKVENHHDEENETTSITDISYTISYEGVTLPPSIQEAEEECPAELSVSERETGKGILKQLRTIRDEVLSKTEKGKELSSLYYKAAPFISAKMLFNKSMRDSVYKDLVQLKPLFADVAKNGQVSAYSITNDDQKAISRLYETARASVPEPLKKQLDQVAKDIGIEQLTGSKVSAVLEKAGMATASSSAPENRYIVKLKEGKKPGSFKSKAQSSGVQALEPLDRKSVV